MTDTTTIQWIAPTERLRHRLGIADVPLPVSPRTAVMLRTDRVEPVAIAIDVDEWLHTNDVEEPLAGALGQAVAALSLSGALELINRGLNDEAARTLKLGLRHAPTDVSLLTHLAIATWDDGLQAEGLGHLARAVVVSQQAGRIAPLLWIFAARALSEAGRHDAALELLEQLAVTEPRIPEFWDLIDTIEARRT